VRSLPLVALERLLVALQGRKMVRRQVAGSHRCSSAQVEVLHRSHTQVRVQAGSDGVGVAGAALQDTAASANYSGSAMAADDRTALRKAAAMADRFRSCAVHSLAQGTGDARIQQYVLGVGKENEALTWEGMDSLAVQTGLG
jgi:hypothetical protein